MRIENGEKFRLQKYSIHRNPKENAKGIIKEIQRECKGNTKEMQRK